MVLQPLKYSLLRSRWFGRNEDRHGVATERCLLCAKPVNLGTAKVVILSDCLGAIIDPANWDREDNGGCFYIGRDCWKRYAHQLAPYEVKTNTVGT